VTLAGDVTAVTEDRPAPARRSATLLVRVWSEAQDPQVPRARLLTVDGPDVTTWATVVGDTAIARGVLDWLHAPPGQGPAVQEPARPSRPAARQGPPVPPLVDADWVEQHRDDPGVVVAVVAGDLGEAEGTAGGGGAGPLGVPGAVVVRWQDLHHPVRRALPGPGGFAALMDSLGVTRGTHVVLCDDGSGARAAAALWCWAFYGHPRTSLLDGGLAGWRAQARPVAPAAVPPVPGATRGYAARPGREDLLLTRDQLLLGFVGAPAGTAVLDCRSPGEFAGRPGPGGRRTGGDRVPGHVPGAVNLPVEDLLVPGTSRLLPVPALEDLLDGRGVAATDHVVVYCGIGDRSPLVWFALHELLGWPDVRCYAGSWAEYGSLLDVPVEVG
jgi:thiosulfate/3-mercaptopyruvate sulfurtransferase